MGRQIVAEKAKTNFDELIGKDCVFVADWLKTYKSFVPYLKVFKNDLYLSLYLQYIKTIIQYNTTSRVRIYRGQLH